MFALSNKKHYIIKLNNEISHRIIGLSEVDFQSGKRFFFKVLTTGK